MSDTPHCAAACFVQPMWHVRAALGASDGGVPRSAYSRPVTLGFIFYITAGHSWLRADRQRSPHGAHSESRTTDVHDGVGAVVARHHAHSDIVRAVRVRRTQGSTDYCLSFVSDNEMLVLWDVSLGANDRGWATCAVSVVVLATKMLLPAAACSDDGLVISSS